MLETLREKGGECMGCRNHFDYRRFIAVLYEKDGSYSISPTRRTRGYAHIEVEGEKARLSVHVKNLRPLVAKNLTGTRSRYRTWIIGERSGRIIPVYVGPLEIGRRGGGEIRWDMDPRNVGGAGMPVDDLIGIEILIQDNATHLYGVGYPVLTGFLELTEAQTPEYPNLEKIKPFGDMPGHKWWKFYPPLNLSGEDNIAGSLQSGGMPVGAKLPCLKLDLNVGLGYTAKPVFQGHQLIGLQYDEKGAVKYLVHGVPGMFCQEDQPFHGETGYIHWQPLPGQSYQAGNYGYWLIHIDAITGEVVFPVKETPPPSCSVCLRDRDKF